MGWEVVGAILGKKAFELFVIIFLMWGEVFLLWVEYCGVALI